jgi:hypothetical protein
MNVSAQFQYNRSDLRYAYQARGRRPELSAVQAGVAKALKLNPSVTTLDSKQIRHLVASNAQLSPHTPLKAVLDLNGDGRVVADELKFFSGGAEALSLPYFAKTLVRLDAMDGILDGRIKRSSMDMAAEEAKGTFTSLNREALRQVESLDERNLLELRDRLYKLKARLYQTDGTYRPDAQGTDLDILVPLLKEMAERSKMASILEHQGGLNPQAWTAKFMAYLNEVFLGGNVPLLPKSRHTRIDLSDTGWSDRMRDRTENQTFHTLALVAIAYHLGDTMAAFCNAVHETIDPIDMVKGKSAEDYRASAFGAKIGSMLRKGELTPEGFADQARRWFQDPDRYFPEVMQKADRQIGWLFIQPAVPPSYGFKDPRENIHCTSRRIIQTMVDWVKSLNPFKTQPSAPPQTLHYYG